MIHFFTLVKKTLLITNLANKKLLYLEKRINFASQLYIYKQFKII